MYKIGLHYRMYVFIYAYALIAHDTYVRSVALSSTSVTLVSIIFHQWNELTRCGYFFFNIIGNVSKFLELVFLSD